MLHLQLTAQQDGFAQLQLVNQSRQPVWFEQAGLRAIFPPVAGDILGKGKPAGAPDDVAVNKAPPILYDGKEDRRGGGFYGGRLPEVGITVPRYDPFPPYIPSEPPPPGYNPDNPQEPPHSGGGGGRSTPPAPKPGPVDKIINTSTLSRKEKAKLESALNEIMKNCIGSAMYQAFVDNSRNFNFSINSNLQGGTYDPRSRSIQFKDIDAINAHVLQEELFHAYQDLYYRSGTTQYMSTGRANIEFEAKLTANILCVISQHPGCPMAVNSNEYAAWVYSITNGGVSFPTSYAAYKGKYFHYMKEFVADNPGYTKAKINYRLTPGAMNNLINNSKCPK